MFEDTLDKIFEVVKVQWAKEIRIQGHSLTGSLERSLEAKYIKVLKGFIIDFLANDYGNILDAGTKPNRIPFNEGSGATKSKYIDGLTDFAKKRFGLNDKEAQSAAFAIAKTQKKEGMPTKNSFRFSKNGKRTGLIDDTLENATPAIEKIIEDSIFNFIVNYNFQQNV